MAANHTLTLGWGDSYTSGGLAEWPMAVYDIYDSKDSSVHVQLPMSWNQSSEPLDAQNNCYNPIFLFAPNARNFYGCAVIAASAFLVQTHNFLVDKAFEDANPQVQYGSLEAFNASRVIRQIVGCAEASCTNNTLGDCDSKVIDLTQDQVVTENLGEVLRTLQSLCSVLTKEPEADIAGPGIAVSYYIQVALSIWFFIFCGILPHEPDSSTFFAIFSFFKSWIRWHYIKFRRRSDPEVDSLRSTLTRLRSTRFSVALYSAIIEFQETQTFLVMAIETATLIMVLMNSESLAIRVDLSAAKDFATANTLLVLTTQAIMQRRGMYWWYTFILTTIVYILCAIIQMHNLPAPSSSQDPALQLRACGGERSILQTCIQYGPDDYSYYGTSTLSDKSNYFRAYMAIMIFLTVDYLGHIPHLRKMMASTLKERKIEIPSWIFKISSFFGKALWFCLVITMAMFIVANVYQVDHLVRQTMSSKKQWTFGQVVAVLVWAPVLSKYIYYNIFGIERGVGERIDDQYKVVHNEERIAPSAPTGAQVHSGSSRNSVAATSYTSLSTVGDGPEDQGSASIEVVSAGIRRKPLPPRTDSELPR
ncbi:hypothetical protein CABS01_05993 [Colletotrichum abscissum]|uniref:Uncharacterized protein n=1 Tax=Colletotrichum abscissum TaxID=1671311 RepID=A0A9P9X4X4_9PEZI|nr:uncharacterized protein CABS01_05993 [Colletotrichum abscissum]KAI3536917.1 hypothetical protein CABS02_12358 [Colletotrichum abscissum]KAK1518459.1 hypothetical protein CABS01_05993 [Colletotrichum abscissum]